MSDETPFQRWIRLEVRARGHGSAATYAAMLEIGAETVKRWQAGSGRPNKANCKRLGQLTGVPWQDIATLAGCAFVGNNGRSAGPLTTTPLDKEVWPAAYPNCDACQQRNGDDPRREVCRVFIDFDLPGLCEPWPIGALMKLLYTLAERKNEL